MNLLLMFGSAVTMALREIRRSVMRSVLTTLGIVIGVGAVIALMTLGEGAKSKVTADIANMGVNMLSVWPGVDHRGPTQVGSRPFTLADARAIKSEVPLVARVAPVSSRAALAVAQGTNFNTQIYGVDNEYFAVRNLTIASGRAFSDIELEGGQSVCILGATVQKELFGAKPALGESVRAGRISCTVIGLVTPKGQSTFGMDQDDFILMPLKSFQRRVAGNTQIDSISVSAVDERATSRAQAQIEALLRQRRRIEPGEVDDFRVRDMKEIAETLESVTGALTVLLSAVAAVSLLVGGIGIMNIMLVSVTERTREIGTRLAIGARGREILLQFLVESMVLSTLGGLLGITLGLGGSYLATRAFNMEFIFLPGVTLGAFVFSGAVGMLFGYLPALRAARLNPIDALRHE